MNLVSLTQPEVLALLNTHPELTVKDFKTIISTYKGRVNSFKVNTIKVGDVFKCKSLGAHPAVIISIKNGLCYCLLLTTEETTESIIGPISSRYMSGFVTSTLVTINISSVIDKVYTIYGNNKELSKYKKLFKETIKNI